MRSWDATSNLANQTRKINHILFSLRQKKVEDVISSLLDINTVKGVADVIKESSLELDFNFDASFCEAQDFKQSLRLTKVPGVLITFFSVLMK